MGSISRGGPTRRLQPTVDVIGGTLMAYIAYVVFVRSYPRELIAESDRRRAPLRALGAIGAFAFVVACVWILYQTRMVVL